MKLWKDGHFIPLLEEGRAIQSRLNRSSRQQTDISNIIPQKFADFMKKGKLQQAIRLISEGETRILPLDEITDEHHTVRDILRQKHPEGQNLNETISPSMESKFHTIIFEEIDATSILKSALQTEGSSGPSGQDAHAWKRMCSSFQAASADLCAALASCAKHVSTNYVDPLSIKPLTSCRLIALDKCPGVRPIGIGEVSRRIMSKAILSVIKSDILEAVGSRQYVWVRNRAARLPSMH